ncbi:PaaI family thioesterase [Acidiferrimicrobium sp. IK]|uniref:PaaI family thioesterase n=1 Tax=Acidiferrimicrobium sp. IK TaxID=2871700 RepID=UPI0021CAFCF1|nr:PaaI family thioesterase [Acidiferrimicrobium sp. IK]MCU4186159.1 PaaI family thioesterase [Acidiferrimicrobium sp. IK]
MTPAELNQFLSEGFPDRELPYMVEAVTDVGVRLRLPVGPEHQRPGGSVSGPTMMSLADGAAWTATLSRIGPVAMTVTSSLSINFLRRPPLDAHLLAEAELLRLGRRLSVTDVRMVSEDTGVLVAQATVTYSIP